jgi:hypothetical protein
MWDSKKCQLISEQVITLSLWNSRHEERANNYSARQ